MLKDLEVFHLMPTLYNLKAAMLTEFNFYIPKIKMEL